MARPTPSHLVRTYYVNDPIRKKANPYSNGWCILITITMCVCVFLFLRIVRFVCVCVRTRAGVCVCVRACVRARVCARARVLTCMFVCVGEVYNTQGRCNYKQIGEA